MPESRFNAMFTPKSNNELLNVIAYALDNNIPICYIWSQIPHVACGNCVYFAANVLNTDEMQEYVKSNKKYLIVYAGDDIALSGIQFGGNYRTTHFSNLFASTSNTYVILAFLWRKTDGKFEKYSKGNIHPSSPAPNVLIDRLNDFA